MGILHDFFNTPGIGGLFTIAVLLFLIIVYCLTLRWISNAGKTGEVESQPVDVKSQPVETKPKKSSIRH